VTRKKTLESDLYSVTWALLTHSPSDDTMTQWLWTVTR